MKSITKKICCQATTGTDEEFTSGAEERLDCVATAAFYQAAERHFFSGRKCGAWLEAEAEFLKAERTDHVC